MEQSILKSVKNYVGVNLEEEVFDEEILTDVNTVFMTLNQIGAGPSTPFTIADDSSVWTDFMANIDEVPQIKTYVFLRVRMLFDPPASGTLETAIQEAVSELEWRIGIAVDPVDQNGG